MRRTSWGFAPLVVVLALLLWGCNGPNRSTQPSAASGLHLDVTASPNTVRGRVTGSASAFGGCSTIQVKVFDTNGQLVDGAAASVTTTLGVFREGDESFVGLTHNTIRGVAIFAWCSENERGTSTITATVEDAHDTVFITIL